MLDDTPPSDELVRWAAEVMPRLTARPLLFPWDRPWYRTPPPPKNAVVWSFRCRCIKDEVCVERFDCEGGQHDLFIGQCRRCLAILHCTRAK